LARKNLPQTDAQATALSLGKQTQLANALTTQLNTMQTSYNRYRNGAIAGAGNAYSAATAQLLLAIIAAVLLAMVFRRLSDLPQHYVPLFHRIP
jgi:hypothetical protein